MDINEICGQVLGNVPSALGCAVVDLESGLLLGVNHKVTYFTQSYLDTVAAAAVDMFRGRTIGAVEQMLSNIRGSEHQHLIKEVQMTTEHTYHFMAIVPEKPSALLVLITDKKVNLGMGWAAMRRVLPDIAPLCP